jgi:hypothetical protein|tara:strand:+ start:117 stop:266 length:150 start_codon:yes stop_codon:yes gene_type:complete
MNSAERTENIYIIALVGTFLSGIPVLFFATVAVAVLHWFFWVMFDLGDE